MQAVFLLQDNAILYHQIIKGIIALIIKRITWFSLITLYFHLYACLIFQYYETHVRH